MLASFSVVLVQVLNVFQICLLVQKTIEFGIIADVELHEPAILLSRGADQLRLILKGLIDCSD